ncbi:MAG: MMPL family transporter, partial [Woeseia sp.]
MSDKTGNDHAPSDSGEPGRTDDSQGSALHIAIAQWADWMNRAALPVALALIVASGLVLRFTIDHLGISTDTSDMLSPELDFRRVYSDYQRSLPQFVDTMVVVVSGDTPDLAGEASVALADHLRDSPDLFKSAYLPAAGDFFKNNGLLFLGIDELQELSDELVAAQAFFGRLADDPSLEALLSLTGLALDRVEAGESLDIEPFLLEIDAALTADREGRYYQVSWQQLFQGPNSRTDDRLRLIILQPRLDYGQLQPAADAMRAVRRAARELQLDPAHGVRVQITGEVALAHEELQSASRGAAIAGILSLVLVTVVLGVGLGTWQLVVATVVTLICGLIMTAGFAAVAIGHLNLISIAFAVLYIGLGVHYAVHLGLRYRELVRQQLPHAAALRQSVRDVGGALLICTATTATGFYAFVPTSFTGVSELGLIAGTGMLISLVLTLSLLPALLSLFPVIRTDVRPKPIDRTVAHILRAPAKHPRIVLWLAIGTCVLAILALQAVRFDANPIRLRDPETESVRTFNELLQSNTTSPWTLNILADNRAQAARWATQVGELALVDGAVTIDRFIPSEQPEKLALIDDLALLLGPLTATTTSGHGTGPATQITALQKFAAAVNDFETADEPLMTTVQRLQGNLRLTLSRLLSELPAEQTQHLGELEQRLLGSLPALLDRLAAALRATEIRQEDLPTELVERWVTGDGRYRIDVLPAKPLLSDQDLQAFVKAVRSVVPNATGPAVFNIESGRVVV